MPTCHFTLLPSGDGLDPLVAPAPHCADQHVRRLVQLHTGRHQRTQHNAMDWLHQKGYEDEDSPQGPE